MSDDRPAATLTDHLTLREVIGAPMPLAANKEMPCLDHHCRQFISLSPFLCLGTMDAQGKADVSPRGDAPGFVKVLNDRTLLIPDRPGNRRVDSMSNILSNPSVGLLFLVPGVEETLRVNGRASIISDPELVAEMAVDGKVPQLAIKIEVDEVFFHCGKALKRSKLWDPGSWIDRKGFPSYGKIMRDQRKTNLTVEELEKYVENDYRTRLY